MGGFGSILKKGKKIFATKEKSGIWSRCENCNARNLIYEYIDNEKQTWMLCECCISIFAKDEEEEE
ncbi:MAG: hypothetical protein WC523_00080 [Patescibacteria group bacterium]